MNISNHIAAVAVKSNNTHNDELLQHIWNNRNTSQFFNVEVVSVAKSGASRKMVINVMFKDRLIDVTHLVADLLGNSISSGIMMVRGGGMDMIFSVLYNLYLTIGSKQSKNNSFKFKAVNSYNLS